mgnify:CR=1 FL=1
MTLKKLSKIAFWVALVTLYLNIGWGLGYYYHYNIFTKKFESASWHAKLLGGHCALFALDKETNQKLDDRRHYWGNSLSGDQARASIVWPLILLISLGSWIGHIAFWILKFIFAGGLFKLVFGIP